MKSVNAGLELNGNGSGKSGKPMLNANRANHVPLT